MARATRDIAASARNKTLALADKVVMQADQKVTAHAAKRVAIETMPRTTHQRDTGRDGTMTRLGLSLCMLVEFFLREYFGGLGIEWRTFIELFVALPVTVQTTTTRRRFQIRANTRQPELMARLADAIRDINHINARKIRRDGLLLVFELHGLPDAGKVRSR